MTAPILVKKHDLKRNISWKVAMLINLSLVMIWKLMSELTACTFIAANNNDTINAGLFCQKFIYVSFLPLQMKELNVLGCSDKNTFEETTSRLALSGSAFIPFPSSFSLFRVPFIGSYIQITQYF